MFFVLTAVQGAVLWVILDILDLMDNSCFNWPTSFFFFLPAKLRCMCHCSRSLLLSLNDAMLHPLRSVLLCWESDLICSVFSVSGQTHLGWACSLKNTCSCFVFTWAKKRKYNSLKWCAQRVLCAWVQLGGVCVFFFFFWHVNHSQGYAQNYWTMQLNKKSLKVTCPQISTLLVMI